MARRGRPRKVTVREPVPDNLAPEQESDVHVRNVVAVTRAQYGRDPTPSVLLRWAAVYRLVADKLTALAANAADDDPGVRNVGD